MTNSIKKTWYDNAWRTGMRLSRPAHDYVRYIKMLGIKTPGTAQQEIGETMLSLREWRSLFELSGFKIERVGYDLGRSWMKLFTWAIPIRFTYQFVFLLRKK